VLYAKNRFEGRIVHRLQGNTWDALWSQDLSCDFPDHQKRVKEELIRVDVLAQNTLFNSKNNDFYHIIADYI
jgi:hypothetical protein